ncbi:Stage II sporulation protein E (SpoIIE) [Saccharicrinis carchari]|uniref:Stage II sporulation protein E (SpoIIE) n=1 Tax=Saccharicrinis carchari TaxID=1168039 RepID=A0A521D5V0_SACCC|nr:response regulator [Saccharicrinis carchari]SMO67086.1 Stage II sporulation protein E (SpoIIE) [Saccharicrinis carchari]
MFTPEPQKILIVDDSASNIKVLQKVLDQYKCIVATSGANALLLAKAEKQPDLILLEVVMDNMNGYDVCEELKQDQLTKDIPVIFLTDQNQPETLVKGFKVGASDFINKPFHEDVLRARVANQLKYKKIADNNLLYLKSIEAIYDTITDSMYYAQRIQEATLPHKSYLDKVLGEHFLFYKPRDIVSGDFYLVHQIAHKILLVVADCTGHGVPGALMSMMSMALINEIINIEKTNRPNLILDQLRTLIIKTFSNDGNNIVSDGLDAAIVLIDPETDSMEYAGANLPIYLIRNNELIEFKGNRMPVGIYPSQAPFSNHKIKLRPGDLMYFFTDGYPDQFGGEANRKMMLGHFKALLLKQHNLSMKEQKKLLSDYFNDWMGHNEQIDDVLLMGYRYKG